MSSLRTYTTFSELRRDMRGSANWSNHIDEIAESAGRVEVEDARQGLFDSFEDFDDDDES